MATRTQIGTVRGTPIWKECRCRLCATFRGENPTRSLASLMHKARARKASLRKRPVPKTP